MLSSRVTATTKSIGTTLEPIGQDAHNFWGTEAVVPIGAPVHLTVNLVEPGELLIDSGTATGNWAGSSTIQLQPQGSTTGGLTEEQSLQLSQTHLATYTSTELDSLLTTELTAGPSEGPVNAQLPLWCFGVIVRIATVPEQLLPGTPDGDYWGTTLAVVRVYRAADLWLRVPVHTSSRLVSFYGDVLVAAFTQLTPAQWILNMSLQVTFLPGVTGQVFLMRTP